MTTTTKGRIEQVDPATLTIALNVRTDAKLDKDFVASIKQLGVLQPPMVTENETGGYDVVLGQRRVLASVEAKLAQIPVYVVDQTEADAARIIDQLTENDQRQQLTEAERIGGYKQLALFELTPAQIAKKTATSKDRIQTALTIADNPAAITALAEQQITLEHAAAIVEFADDRAAVQTLTVTPTNKLEHTLRQLRDARALAELKKQLQAELEQLGVVRLKNGEAETRELTPDEQAEMQARSEAEARRVAAVHELRDQLTAAEEVRRAWIHRTLFQRRELPKDVTQFIAWTVLDVGSFFDWDIQQPVLDYLDINIPDDAEGDDHEHVSVAWTKSALAENPKLAERILLAFCCHLGDQAVWWWASDADGEYAQRSVRYLTHLKEWGYGLADIEEQILDRAASAETDPDEDE